MKLAIIHPFQFRLARGIERVTWSLASTLSSKCVQVDILTWSWPNPVSWGTVPPTVQIRRVPYFRYFQAYMAIPYYLKWLAYNKYDWVMLFFAGYGEAETLALMQKFCAQPYCAVFHFPRQQVPHRYTEFERFNLAHQADHLVAVSKYVAEGVEIQFGRNCSVIGNAVDAEAFQPSFEKRATARQKLGIEQDTPVLVSLAALEERKGIQWIIRALPYLLPEFPNLRYFIVGDGAYRPNLEAEVCQLQLGKNVHLVGRSDDVISYLAAADIGCLPSYGEAFPVTLVEYMAMELPVLTSYHPPFPELIHPSWGGMVDEKDSQAVARELRTLLQSPDHRRAMGQAGRQQVLHHHTWDQVAHKYLSLLAAPGIK